jgi:cytosine/adenosine deaminase-related metal-dependent hydrolase
MKGRRISAGYVFTLLGKPLKNGIVVTDEQGVVVDVIDTKGNLTETEGVEHYSGILCPGFINTHCHLELSHLKGKIAEHLHLPGFLHQILLQRNQDQEFQEMAARQADRFMWKSGIVAVGDIANSSFTLGIKEESPIFYHTFIECFGFLPEKAPRAFEYAEFVSRLYEASRLKYSIVPHSPYSVSDDLFELIAEDSRKRDSIVSVHHQESAEEDKMFADKSGTLINHYSENLKLDTTFWKPTGKSSTDKVLDKIPSANKLLLVHNTWLGEENLRRIQEIRSSQNTFLVTCPSANLYIETRLPDYRLLLGSGFPICIGTDSLASNHTLSIIEEMKVIGENFPEITMDELLEWSCINGARALGIDDWAGSIEIGKKPGINLISGVDLKTMKFTPNSKVKKML